MWRLKWLIGALSGLSLFAVSFLIQAQTDTTPTITSFTTTLSGLDRGALSLRTARVPVAWTTSNRTVLANLVFEQVLPDGSVINVELPRLIPWVNSNGNGVAAPILPHGNVNEIRLRVRLVHLLNSETLSSRELVLPITNDGSGNSGAQDKIATIQSFVAATQRIPLDDLASGRIRVPVTWSVSDRPLTATLVFEQVMPDGTLVNVELPRDTPWVNSADSGVVAPRLPTDTDNLTEIRLRLRVIDLLFGRVFDQRDIIIAVDHAPQPGQYITAFSTTATSADRERLNAGAERIAVSWNVANRPNNTNLVFEQVYPDGTSRNAELPRDVLIVPSSGNGIVQLNAPPDGVTQVVFRVRLVDLATNTTLDSRQLSLPIANANSANPQIISGEACYQAPFAPANGLKIGEQGRVWRNSNDAGASVVANKWPNQGQFLGSLDTGEIFTVIEGPVCVVTDPTQQVTLRQWRVKGTLEGWVSEYSIPNDGSYTYYIGGVNTPEPEPVTIISFTATPSAANPDGAITLSWEVENAARINIYAGSYNQISALSSGTITLNVKDIFQTNPISITLYASDKQNNHVDQHIAIPIETAVSIENFTASPAEVVGGQAVTFSWEIAGTFTQASVSWVPSGHTPTIEQAFTVSNHTGTTSFTIPEYVNGQKQFTLNVTDASGVYTSKTVAVNITCANIAFFANDPDLTGKCAAGPATTIEAAYQPFERGFMVWHALTDARIITAFYNDGTLAIFSDWDGSEYTIIDTPPAGLVAPERGFGYIWITKSSVRDALGWATSPEQGYVAMYQATRTFQKYESALRYLTLPNGRTVRYQTDFGGATQWVYVN